MSRLSSYYVIAGTNTEIGKTVVSALLTRALRGVYWKPVQSGILSDRYGATDRERVLRMAQLEPERTLPEAYVFDHSLSPHLAAQLENVQIEPKRLALPRKQDAHPIIIEGAGGLLVPYTQNLLQIDVFQSWNQPVILCASTQLGTINHTLLSIEALKSREIPILGVIFIGEENSENVRAVQKFSGVKILGRVPFFETITSQNIDRVFEEQFRLSDFEWSPSEFVEMGLL